MPGQDRKFITIQGRPRLYNLAEKKANQETLKKLKD